MHFLPYQKRWINDTSRLKLLEKSRQIGMSWASAYALVRRQANPTARLDTWISSRDEIQAGLFLEDCRKFADGLDEGARACGGTVMPAAAHSPARQNSQSLRLANGTRLHSLSSNPDAQAGKRGPRLLDEFALHPDPRRLYAIAYPGITWGGQLEILSTHRGAQNFFAQLVAEARHGGNPKNFSLHRVTLQDALDEGFLTKLKGRLPPGDPRQLMDAAAYFDFIRASCPDHETFLQEYMCVPSDESTAFLPWDLIAACEYADHEYIPLHPIIPIAPLTPINPKAFPKIVHSRTQVPRRVGNAPPYPPSAKASHSAVKGELYLGVDIGRVHDLTVFWLLESIGGVHLTRDVLVLEKQPFALQEELLYQRLALPGLRRACLDATGLGRQLAERALEHFGSRRIEAITFTAAIKEDLAYSLRHIFERRAVRIPSEKNIRADLRAIKKTTTSAGNLRFAADRGPGGHADRFWALALALHASRSPAAPMHYEGKASLTPETNRPMTLAM